MVLRLRELLPLSKFWTSTNPIQLFPITTTILSFNFHHHYRRYASLLLFYKFKLELRELSFRGKEREKNPGEFSRLRLYLSVIFKSEFGDYRRRGSTGTRRHSLVLSLLSVSNFTFFIPDSSRRVWEAGVEELDRKVCFTIRVRGNLLLTWEF